MIPKNLSRDQDESFKKVRAEIVSTLKKYGIKKAGIFGSYAKGKQKKNSDVDILIEPVRGMGYEFVEIKLELEDRIGKSVDLITYKGIHPLIKSQVLKEEVRIL